MAKVSDRKKHLLENHYAYYFHYCYQQNRNQMGQFNKVCLLTHVRKILKHDNFCWYKFKPQIRRFSSTVKYLLCSPKNFGGAYSRRCVRASVRPCVRASVRPSRSCPRKFSETACRISMKLHGNIKYQRWMRISPACSGSMIFPRVIAL